MRTGSLYDYSERMLDPLVVITQSTPPPQEMDPLGMMKVAWGIFAGNPGWTALLIVIVVAGMLIPVAKKGRRKG